MITHVPTPFDRLMERLTARFGAWLDTLCADQPEPESGRCPSRRASVPDERFACGAACAWAGSWWLGETACPRSRFEQEHGSTSQTENARLRL